MSKYKRRIEIAFDKSSGEILEAEDLFKDRKHAFQMRAQFHRDELEPYCCECSQKLIISSSRYERIHFKHHAHAEFCILKDGNLSPKELEEFSRMFKSKESPRHVELKNKIAQGLANVDGVERDSIRVDDKYVVDNERRKRPDVYCVYKGKKLAFEIQLSDLSLRYILSRHDFYKENGIYLIWILADFDVKGQSTMEKDIKYLTKHENFFKLDETSETFCLSCDYKFPFITDDNRVLTKWLSKSVSLSQINFDESEFQIYYYNFGDNRLRAEEEQKRREQQLKEQERRNREEARINAARHKAVSLVSGISDIRANAVPSFDHLKIDVSKLDFDEAQIFNDRFNFLKLDSRGRTVLLNEIESAKQKDVAFIDFVLSSWKIRLDVNAPDPLGGSVFQAIYKNKQLPADMLLRSLFRRGYAFTASDEQFIRSVSTPAECDSLSAFFKTCTRIKNKSLMSFVFDHAKLIYIIESAKEKKIIGFNYKAGEWIAFANNAIEYYGVYWSYIESAFRYFGLWDKLIESDKKGSFQKKLKKFYDDIPSQDFVFDEVFKDVYNEVISQNQFESTEVYSNESIYS